MTGWTGLPEVTADGTHWTLTVAAEVLGVEERDLRDLIRITGIQPTGTMKTADFRRSGRNPRTYSGTQLVRLYDGVRRLTETLSS
jgi:hypothetical protein